MTAVDLILHFDIADEEPGVAQTEASLKDWFIPDLLASVRRVIGHPGDSAVVWAGDPRYPKYEVVFPEAEEEDKPAPRIEVDFELDEMGRWWHATCKDCGDYFDFDTQLDAEDFIASHACGSEVRA